MGMPQLVVTAVLVEGRSKGEVARQYGVSRRWVITLVQRYLAEGDTGLEPRSRRPLSSPQRTPPELEQEIIEIRKNLDRAGHEAGAATIAFHLHQRHGRTPAVSTIWRILVDRGFVTRSRTSARRAATCGSPPSSRTSAGSSTSPTSRSPTAATWRSSTSSMTTPGSAWAVTPSRYSRPPMSTTVSVKPRPALEIRPACSVTTGRCSPAARYTVPALIRMSRSTTTGTGRRSKESRSAPSTGPSTTHAKTIGAA